MRTRRHARADTDPSPGTRQARPKFCSGVRSLAQALLVMRALAKEFEELVGSSEDEGRDDRPEDPRMRQTRDSQFRPGIVQLSRGVA